MDQQQMTEQESLRLIGEMIGKAKRSYVTRGIASIVWGVIIIICSLLTWWQVQYHHDLGFDVWIFVFAAIIPQVYFAVKEKRQRKFVAHDEDTMTYVWSAFGICIFLLSAYNGNFGSEHTTTLFHDAVWDAHLYHRRCVYIQAHDIGRNGMLDIGVCIYVYKLCHGYAFYGSVWFDRLAGSRHYLMEQKQSKGN